MANILVIDNDPVSRGFLVGLLQNEGYAVDQTSDERSCIELFQAKKHDLLLSEIAMPGKQRLEMLRKLHWSNPDIRCLVFSGAYEFSAYACLENARACGALDIFTNPYDTCTVLELVRLALDT